MQRLDVLAGAPLVDGVVQVLYTPTILGPGLADHQVPHGLVVDEPGLELILRVDRCVREHRQVPGELGE